MEIDFVSWDSVQIINEEIGSGNYSKTILCIFDGELCALKVMQFDLGMERDSLVQRAVQVHHEIDLCLYANRSSCSFLVQSRAVLKPRETQANTIELGIVFELVKRGTLSDHIHYETSRGRCFTMDRVKFYAAEMILAVRQVHSLGFAHRDVKPSNFMIGDDGHLKLIDFGSCMYLDQHFMDLPMVDAKEIIFAIGKQRFSMIKGYIVGTPSYMSPEAIKGNLEYSQSTDYYAVGVSIYQMVTGVIPQGNQSDWTKHLACLPEDCQSLIESLVHGDQTRSIHFDALCVHPFFKSIDWRALAARSTKSPEYDKEAFEILYLDEDSSIDEEDQQLFQSFQISVFQKDQ